jgi:hypothetical protein
MNFTNLIYLILWIFCYYFILLFIPYTVNLLTSISIFSGLWATIPVETQWLIGIFLYIVIPLVAIAYAIKSSSPESQIVVSQ